MKHIISADQFSLQDIEAIFSRAETMETASPRSLQGKILATLFYEPSTRTRFSFETAMHALGGQVITAENAAGHSAAKKGESLEDMIRTVNNYADAIVLRHPDQGSARVAAQVSRVPLINAGDGSGEHPTQALLDLYTIKKECDRLQDLHVAFVGDLLYGRTVHSLLRLLRLFPIRVSLVAPPSLALPPEYKQLVPHAREYTTFDSILADVDVLYVTRVQQERFVSQEEYQQMKGSYVITSQTVTAMKSTARIMHPFPRVDEISSDVDNDPRAAYFRQAKNGLFVRMALLDLLLG